MKDVAVADVRNVVLMGHTGSGKTALTDRLLFKMGVNDRLGSTQDGSSMADWTDEEKHRKISIWAKPFDGLFKGASGTTRLVLTDTPGYADFYGQVVAASAVADCALLTVDASSGIQIGTNRAWRRCEELGLPRALVITGIDKENANVQGTIEALQAIWGDKCIPVTLPAGDGKNVVDVLGGGGEALAGEVEALKGRLTECAAESDDALIEKFLGGETLTEEEVARGLRKAVLQGGVVPIFSVSPTADIGVDALVEGMRRLFPSPMEHTFKNTAGEPINPDASAPFVGLVWRVVNDPFVGQLTFVRVLGGTIKADSEAQNATKQSKERLGQMYVLNGKKQDAVAEAEAGDIVAIPKLKHTALNDTLCAVGQSVEVPPILFPRPTMEVAVAPKSKADEDKMGPALHRIADDDPTIHVERSPDTHEMILSGMGDVHLDVTVERMKARSHVEVVMTTPKVPYRETVTALGEGHYRHKKQSGGRGQYAEVYFRVDPLPEGEDQIFVDALVGTAIPRSFLPAIEKGLHEAMQRGAVAGYPVIGTRVAVYDGSSHDVDSSEIAFKIASIRAFRDGMSKAKPVLLEPIMKVKVLVPEQFMGDITGDLNHKRGRILGMGNEDGLQAITAEVPKAEMFKFSTELRSITGGRGSFEMEFVRYDVVPSNVAQKVIAESQRHEEEED